MTPLSHPRPQLRLVEKSSGDLGPNQLRWLRKNVEKFKDANDAVLASDEHAQRIREKLAGAQ